MSMRFSLRNLILPIRYNQFKNIIEATLGALPNDPVVEIKRYSGLLQTTSFLDDFVQSNCDEHNKPLNLSKLDFSEITKEIYKDTFYFDIGFRNAPFGSKDFHENDSYYWVSLEFKGGNKKQATFYAQCGNKKAEGEDFLENIKTNIIKQFPIMLVGDGFFGRHTNLNGGGTIGYMKGVLGF